MISLFEMSQPWLIAVNLCSIRASLMLTLLPFSSDKVLHGPARIVVGICLGLPSVPAVATQLVGKSYTGWSLAMLGIKEVFIGLVIGFLVAVPFWVLESVGTLIDNQTGSNNSSIFDPMTGHEGGVTPAVLMQFAVATLFAAGGLILILEILISSYKVWFVLDPLPFEQQTLGEFFYFLSSQIIQLTVTYAAPVLIVLVMVELSLGFVARFAPNLNVFQLSSSVKNFVAYMVLYVMCAFLSEALVVQFGPNGVIKELFLKLSA